MQVPADEHERTMAFAEIALGQMRALRQPATRNFEVWYHYATGYIPSLNRLINDTIARTGTLVDGDIDAIYESCLSPTRMTDRIDQVNHHVMDEMKEVMAIIAATVGSSSSYSESLANASRQLAHTQTPQDLRSIVETLVHDTRTMRDANLALEARLNASQQEISLLQQSLEIVRTESCTDPLTSLANRKYFDAALTKAIDDAAQSGRSVSLIMTDIDHFKSFNDTYGHLTGDQVLRLVAMSMKHNLKRQDIAARYGGEEFAIILLDTTLPAAITVADRIRCVVMTKDLMKRSTGEHLGRVTVSVGVATLQPGDTVVTLIERADACLYAAKRAGRNCVISEADPATTRGQRQQVA
jgi:diguanylate cyclase